MRRTRSTTSANNLFDPPSIGSKGTVLLVDAHSSQRD